MNGDDASRRAQSIRQRLLNAARQSGSDAELYLIRYASGALLSRLSRSPHRDRLVLRGAALFHVWGHGDDRPTRDIDLMSPEPMGEERLRQIVADLCSDRGADDGVVFDVANVRTLRIIAAREHPGFRVRVTAHIGESRVPLGVDFGFSDAVRPVNTRYPSLVQGLPESKLQAYPPDAFVAEKLEAMVRFGRSNTRMKDFFDVVAVSELLPFEGDDLSQAVRETFARRRTILDGATPAPLQAAFYGDRATTERWKSFRQRFESKLPVPSPLDEVGEKVSAFLRPIWEGLQKKRSFDAAWPPGGPWKTNA